MKTILVTGGAGFIGSNFLPYFLEKYNDYKLINLDVLTYAGNLENLQEIDNHPRYEFVQGDICNRELVTYLFGKHDIRGIIHFAAESHVDNSISGPKAFVRTNVHGTFTLLDVARSYWMDAPFEYKKGYETCRMLHVSTDEVYGSLGETGFFTETTPYAPNSPYSASKASSDMLVRSYHHTYGMNVVTTNCSNNFGAKQHHEKLIPVIIRKALAGEAIPIYGDGRNVRDWLYVLDHCTGIDAVFHQGKSGEMYNIGSRNEQNNINLAKTICRILDKVKPRALDKSYEDLISFVKDRPGHDRRYAIDPSKLENELGWEASTDFPTALQATIEWYIQLYEKGSRAPQPKIVTSKPEQEQQKNTTKQQVEKTQNTSQHVDNEPTKNDDPTTNSELDMSKYSHYFDVKDVHEALEGLAEIKAQVIRTRKDYDSYTEKGKHWENKAILLMQKAKNGEMDMSEANALAMELLQEEKKAKKNAQESLKQLSELEYLQSQMEETVQRLKNFKASYQKRVVEMPDSSDTIDMIERMKSKIDKDEILGDLYKESVEQDVKDEKLEQKVNEALGMDKASQEKKRLDGLKKQMGLDKDDE